jgi:molecular chaperone HscB
LSDKLSRIEYILECNAHGITEEDKTDDLEFLGEIMAARETLEEDADSESLRTVQAENAGE